MITQTLEQGQDKDYLAARLDVIQSWIGDVLNTNTPARNLHDAALSSIYPLNPGTFDTVMSQRACYKTTFRPVIFPSPFYGKIERLERR